MANKNFNTQIRKKFDKGSGKPKDNKMERRTKAKQPKQPIGIIPKNFKDLKPGVINTAKKIIKKSESKSEKKNKKFGGK